MRQARPSQTRRERRTDRTPTGIGGWLIFPAVGLVLGLLAPLVHLLVSIVRLVGSNDSVALLQYSIVAWVVVEAAVFSYAIVTTLRFFKKRRSAPRTFVRLLVAAFAATVYLGTIEIAVAGQGGGQNIGPTLLAVGIACAVMGACAIVWGLYFTRSKRVEATFIEGDDPTPCLPYTVVLSNRYLIQRRISWVALAAVVLCVFIVVVVMTVMSGLVGDFKQKNHDYVGDCVVGTKSLVGFGYYDEFMAILERDDFVEAVSPVVKNYALLKSQDEGIEDGVELVGLDPVRHSRVTNFAQTLYHRADDPAKAFVPEYEPNAVGCVRGADVAARGGGYTQYQYGARPPKVSMSLTCFPLTARGAGARSGTSEVSGRKFYFSDVSRSGIARVDYSTVYIPLADAQNLCMAGSLKRINAIHIKFRPGVRVAQGCRHVAQLWSEFKQSKQDADYSELFDTVTVESWKEHRRAFIAPMEKEEGMMAIMFCFVGITSVFIIFVVFYMIVTHKTKDVGVLKSVGVSNSSVLALFSHFAFSIGFLGSLVGIHLAWVFLATINSLEDLLYRKFGWQLWDRTIYAIGDIPHHVEPPMLAFVVLCGILACLLGALVPGYCAARLRPVETLHGSRG